MRPELFSHYFHYGVESGLHITDLALGETYDTINFEDGQWQKTRWERTEQKRQKTITDEHTGEDKVIIERIPAFYLRDSRLLDGNEVSEIIQQLEQMNATIDDILNESFEEIIEPAMHYEAAWRNHTLGEHRKSIEEFKASIYEMIGDNFDLDAKLKMFRIICSEIWHSNRDSKRYYI